MKQKRLMLLGGLRYLLPVIEAAHKEGYYVITADYLPGNIAHRYSDEYCNVSIVDKEAVLREAQRLKIDGIMSFACDPGVVAASYVQNKLSLPSFGPFESVQILQNKDKFRSFLAEHGFNVPWAYGFGSVQEALDSADKFSYPLIVKPVDSAGSKGCMRVDGFEALEKALEYAFGFSIGGRIIVEEFLQKVGCSSDTDCYARDGKLEFVSFNAQRFDEGAVNPFTPAAYSWPSTFTSEQEAYLTFEIQRLISLLRMRTCVFNVETRVCTDGKAYIMELTPRGGGNRLCEMLRYATGEDLIRAVTRAVVNDEPQTLRQAPYNGHWAEIILHSDASGLFKALNIRDDMAAKVVEKDLWVSAGEHVDGFEAANNAIGTLVMRFDSQEELEKALRTQREWLKVELIETLAIIGASTGQAAIMRKAREKGIRTIAFAWKEGAPCADLADVYYPVSIFDYDQIEKICRKENVRGVVSNCSDATAFVASQIASRLGLVGVPVASMELLADKSRVREAVSGVKGLSTIRFGVYDGTLPESYPVVVKPCSGSGKKGVCFASSSEEFMRAVEYAGGHEVLVEEYVQGREISVEAISYQGRNHIIQITDKDTTGGPHFVELGHHQPSSLTEDVKDKVRCVVDAALTAVNLRNGASHTELKISPDGKIYLIEINPRGGGDEISNTLVGLSTDYDYLGAMIDVALDRFVPRAVHDTACAGIYYLCSQSAGLQGLFSSCEGKPWLVKVDVKSYDLSEGTSNYDRNGSLVYRWHKKVETDD